MVRTRAVKALIDTIAYRPTYCDLGLVILTASLSINGLRKEIRSGGSALTVAVEFAVLFVVTRASLFPAIAFPDGVLQIEVKCHSRLDSQRIAVDICAPLDQRSIFATKAIWEVD